MRYYRPSLPLESKHISSSSKPNIESCTKLLVGVVNATESLVGDVVRKDGEKLLSGGIASGANMGCENKRKLVSN